MLQASVALAAAALAAAPPAYADDLLRLAERRGGVFVDRRRMPEHARTVLLTMSNWGFRRFLHNWNCTAAALGLDYGVLSMDGNLHRFLGPSRSVQLDTDSEKREWGTEAYYDLGCHKLDAISILVANGWSVLFSDPDNVFRKPPLSVLDEVTRRRFDAMIQADHPECKDRATCPPAVGKRGRTANGGLHFFSARRGGRVSGLLRRAGELCRRKPRSKLCCDDQQALNKAIAEVGLGQLSEGSFSGSEFCADTVSDSLFSYCMMQPAEHPAGRHAVNLAKVVSFHANWIVKAENKIAKLRKFGLWHWSQSADRCIAPVNLLRGR